MDDDAADLLDVAETDVRPGAAAVGRLEDAVADAEVGTVQAFAASDVEDVGMRRRDGDVADRSGGRLVEDRLPGAAVVVGLPDAAVVHAHEEHARLGGDAHGADRSAGAERTDQAIAQALVERRVDGLAGLVWVRRRGRLRVNQAADEKVSGSQG